MPLQGKSVLVTGSARRIGRHLALSLARAGADVVIHHSASPELAQEAAGEIEHMGRKAWVLQADFSRLDQVEGFIQRVTELTSLFAVVHNAAIFEPLSLDQTSLLDWQRHMNINLTAPFLLSRDFAAQLPQGQPGRIVTILDWRALRPAGDHFPYTISKAALAAMTKSLAAALGPAVCVNGLALGAVLPPSGGGAPSVAVKNTPAGRWVSLDEVAQALLFLLDGPETITGEILHVDGGKHLV